jgi:iron complex outermembrane receptor protein
MSRKNLKFSLTLIASAMACEPVMAELMLEEIIVIAQQRTQSLQDVPIAVQAISSDQLSQASISSISDLSRMAPGLSISNTQNSSYPEIGIRGVSTAIIGVGAEGSTALYLDGVYQRSIAVVSSLQDVSQIEVLKGPQGTLFGRNAAAGAINIMTQAPVAEFEGSLSASYGSDGLRVLSGVFNTPFTDNLHNRLSATVRQRDGWQQDTDSDSADDLYEQDNYSIRNRLLWLASDTVSAELIVDYTKERGTRGGLVIEEGGSIIPGAAFQDTHKIDEGRASQSGVFYENGILVPFNSDTDNESFGSAVLVDWNLSDSLTLKSVSSYRDSERALSASPGGLLSFDPGATPFLPAYVGTEEFGFESYNQEFRISGVEDSVDWFVGVNYFKDKSSQNIEYAVPLVTGIRSGLNDSVSRSEVDIESYALFGDFIFRLTDNLNLTVGARYSYDEKEINWSDVTQGAPDIFYPDVNNGILVASGFAANAKDNWQDISGRVVLDYTLGDDTLIYGSVAQGYKSGGFNSELSPASDPADSFGKEQSISYELGVKSEIFDSRMRINAATFFNQYNGYQFQTTVPGAVAAANLGADAEVKGLELGLAWVATEALDLSFNLSYLDAEFVEDVAVTGPGGTRLAVANGQEMLRAPQWAAQAAADYYIPLTDIGEIRFNVNYSYSDSMRLNNATLDSLQGNGIVFTSDDLRSESYGLVGARIGFVSLDEVWEISIWGTNLTDESYRDADWIAVGNSVYSGFLSSTRAYSSNEPRMYGLDISYNFGE